MVAGILFQQGESFDKSVLETRVLHRKPECGKENAEKDQKYLPVFHLLLIFVCLIRQS